MKIGITCYPTYGGSGVVATELGIELADRDHEIHFITYSDRKSTRLNSSHLVISYAVFFLKIKSSRISLRGRSAASLRQNCVTVFSFSKNHFSSPSLRWSIVLLISSWGSTL